MKKLFVLADSISIHYGPYLEQYLKGFFEYDRKGKNLEHGDLNNESSINGGDSSHVLEFIKQNCPECDVLLVNCGLHDIKTQNNKKQIEEAEYEKNLNELVSLVLSKKKKMVWLSTTSVDDEIHKKMCPSFSRSDKDVIAYNDIAKKVMDRYKIPIIDLNKFTKNLSEPLFADHVHYVDGVRCLQAAFIAGNLLALEKSGNL
ncbi:MAG: SGNH/GDSL hydrolase family protein [Clostridia bacterium]|nr:SGNH/GDSL hydrolase family protein [Clostridia bacterium]